MCRVQNERAVVGKLGKCNKLVTKWASGPSYYYSTL